MSAILAKILTGDVYPGDVVRQQPFHRYLALPERVVRSYTTDRPFGKPIKHEVVKATPIVPKATGDSRHNGLMDVLQKVLQKQGGGGPQGPQAAPIAKSQEQYRDWR